MTIDVDAVLDALARREVVRSADPAILVLKTLIADVDSIQEAQRLSSVSMTPST
ncbi:hypothetical protein [Herbidospora yilanensis]|uniref:hypothetical protein n=1 Tax=Herbidospora yilanensis TaxID=354426 RepID=UPI0012F94DAE|nr:hypothetical protein [Herbidospora yilanensis]